MKAKIAFMHGPHDLRVEEVEVPKLKPDQVLIKTGACGICGSDVAHPQ
jgi:threonine dehydrogenase-like Zn-dependent dehydrogenase